MFPQLGVPLPPSSDDEHTAAARQFMKAVSRREIHSVNGPDRAGFRSVNNEPPMKPLGAGEDYRPPNPFLPNQRWHGTSEGADHAHRVMLRKIRGHKYSQEELSAAFQYFLQSSDAAALEKDAFRWETLIDLKDIIKDQVMFFTPRVIFVSYRHDSRPSFHAHSFRHRHPKLRSRGVTVACTRCFFALSRASL